MIAIPRVMISAPSSGSGKTTVMAALLWAFRAQGRTVQSLKCGPDYIDPMFHTHITGRSTYHADPFFSTQRQLCQTVAATAYDADLALLEGAMGYYDGIGSTDHASADTVARWLKTPVILVVDPKGMGVSVAALCKGFQTFRPESPICGVILSRTSQSMYAYYRTLLERETGLTVYGYLPFLPDVQIASRHLGLMTAGEVEDLDEKLAHLGTIAAQTLDLQGIRKLAESASPLPDAPLPVAAPKKKFRLGIAQDAAFCFYYAENLELLEQNGAELVPFSPLQDTALPEHLSGLYLGGGYPELHLKALSGNTAFLHSLRAQASRKIPIYAECGGFLYLQQAMYDTDGTAYPMAQLLSGTSRRGAHLCRFGYITLTAQEDSLLGAAGTTILGHEFHYADSTENGNAFCATRPNGKHWACMQVTDHITAGFPHLYFPSQPEVAAHFAEACLQYQERNDTTTC